MGNKVSTPTEVDSPTPHGGMRSAVGSIKPRTSTPTATSQSIRTTPRSVDVLDAASLATLSLRPSVTCSTPSRTLATTLKHRKIDRSAFTFFSCGRNVFIHFAGMALLDRDLIKTKPEPKVLEDAAEQVWIEIAMHDPQQRAIWEDAAKEAKIALTSETDTAEVLLEAHCLPNRQAEYQALAVSAIDELLERYAAGTWPKKDETWFVHDTVHAVESPSLETDESDATGYTIECSIERDIVSAINLRDLPSQNFVGFEPSIRRFNPTSSVYSRDIDQSSARSLTPTAAVQQGYPYPTTGPVEVVNAAATARLYLDLNMTPPRSNRNSLRSISTSLYTDVDAEAEIVTTERVTPVKAKIVEC